MKISGIDFPGGLLSALRNSNLVIFAGAGVSMGEPACLPDFNRLAREIARGTGKMPGDDEPVDRFLGNLQKEGTDVHARAAEILQLNTCGEIPRPNSLHKDILLLFSNPSQVRLVTTNFDLLFEDASEDLFKPAPEPFRAPALPLGREFSGIVHIHGNVDHPASMVLTDADFGSAYLIDAWAARFLLQLFQSFPVLFVGYSHQDRIMHYLSRALALPARDSQPRFALVKDDRSEIERWKGFGIRPIVYPKLVGDGHAELYRGIHALANYATLGLLGWQHRISGLARQSPPMNEEDADLIDDALKDPAKTRFFTRAASDPKWIDWLDARGHFQPLFGTAELTEQHFELARWLAATFPRQNPRELLLLIARHGTRLHPEFWFQLARTIRPRADPPLPVDVLSQWSSLLLTTATVPLHEIELCRMAARCAEQELFGNLVEIFDALIAPRLTLLQRSSWLSGDDRVPSPRIDMHLTLVHSSEHTVKRLWNEVIAPHLERLAERLLPRLTVRLRARHQAHCAWQQGHSQYDPEAFRRHAIEPHEQDEFFRPVDVMIDAARDCLEILAINHAEVAARWCDEFADSDVPLLRRLTLHALYTREDLSADEKCEWLLRHMDILDLTSHHEMFRIAHRIYRDMGDTQRRALIETINEYTYPRDEHREQRTASRKFDWFAWLYSADRGCPLVFRELEAIKVQYPHFEPREHPDLTHYVGRVVRIDDKTPWTVEALLSRPANRWVDELMAFERTAPLGAGRSGLLLTIEEAGARRFDWGIDLADALIEGAHWSSDLWTPLLRAWSKCGLDDEQRQRVLGKLQDTELRDEQIREMANFLCESMKPSRSQQINESVQLANELADDLWQRLAETEADGEEFHDWLTRAINHPAGNLAQFWIYSLWYSRHLQDPAPAVLGPEYRSALSRIMRTRTVIGTLGRTVLCRSFAFLLEADELWTRENLLPLFDIDAGLPESTAAWCGFLYGNTTIPAIEAMKPAFLAATSRLETDFHDHELAERFIEAYTYVVFFHVDDPIPEWIPTLLQRTDSDGRDTFARHIRSNLRQLEDEQRAAWWHRWLSRYWEIRTQGTPLPLSSQEIDTMLNWLSELEPIFAEAVDVAVQMPRIPLRNGFILDEIVEANMHVANPESAAKLLNYLRYCGLSQAVWRQANDAINQLLRSDIPQDLKTSLEEIVAVFGLD